MFNFGKWSIEVENSAVLCTYNGAHLIIFNTVGEACAYIAMRLTANDVAGIIEDQFHEND